MNELDCDIGILYDNYLNNDMQMYIKIAADAENADNQAEMKRQHGHQVNYGDTIQVKLIIRIVFQSSQTNIISQISLLNFFAPN